MGKCEYSGRSPAGNADQTQTLRTGPTGLDTRGTTGGERGTTAEGSRREHRLEFDTQLYVKFSARAAGGAADPPFPAVRSGRE